MELKVKVNKDELIGIVQAHRDTHVKQYKEAKEKWQTKMMAIAAKVVEAGKGLKKFPRALRLLSSEPMSYLRVFDELLKMLEMNTNVLVELSKSDFDQFVLGKWHWAHSFNASNMSYGVTGPTGPCGAGGITGPTGDEFEDDDAPDEIVAELEDDELE